MRALRFAHPDPLQRINRDGPRLRPVFLPFAGCPHRCLFCGQHLQTGQADRPLQTAHDELRAELEALRRCGAPRGGIEPAFYGGTFTALTEPWPERFLRLCAEYRDCGVVARVRCSTRPDAVRPGLLSRLAGLGLDMVELGVQSFDDAALRASGRGYAGENALRGCANVRDAGLELGVQLMPGLPGHGPNTFARDIERTARLRPDAARLYPCLVMEGTPLAGLWRRGSYRPWSLERARTELPPALNTLWGAGVAVIRVGLHPEPQLLENLLDGPWHPALGQTVRSRALFDHVLGRAEAFGCGPKRLNAPRKLSGTLMGQGGELRAAWQRAGIAVRYWEEGGFLLEPAG